MYPPVATDLQVGVDDAVVFNNYKIPSCSTPAELGIILAENLNTNIEHR
jgi:hypothetical protein